MPKIWFIRHAESEANVGLATAHPAEIKLTPKGVEQARAVALSFKRQPDLIITSPYRRTLDTAQPTMQRFSYISCEEWPVQEFTYIAPLNTLTSPLERKPKVKAFWERYDPLYVDGDDTESFGAFIDRVRITVESLRQTKADFIAVFSHEQFIRAVTWLSLKGKMEPHSPISSACMKQFKDFLGLFPLPNAAILPVQLQDDGEMWMSSPITSHLHMNIYATNVCLSTV